MYSSIDKYYSYGENFRKAFIFVELIAQYDTLVDTNGNVEIKEPEGEQK